MARYSSSERNGGRCATLQVSAGQDAQIGITQHGKQVTHAQGGLQYVMNKADEGHACNLRLRPVPEALATSTLGVPFSMSAALVSRFFFLALSTA